MAFPATYNISYYRGDSYDFVINPKNSNGTAFNLSGYTGLFVIATERGNAESVITESATASVNASAATVTCSIPPSIGSQLSGTSYVYDIEITNSSTSANYTLLTGTITVTQDVARTGE